MPKRCNSLSKVPWPEVQALYNQGVKAPQIAEQYNVKPATIHQRAYRHNWTKLRKISTQDNQEVIEKRVNESLAAESDVWVEKMRSIYNKSVEDLEAKQKAGKLTLRDLKTLAEITELTDKGGRRNLGLDKQEHTSNTFITIIESSDLVKSARLQGADGEHVIDVDPVDE